MVESVGKKLAAAREAKGLSLDEAARATKVRPDKLAALEQGDFSAFPNNTYARGFLVLYGRYLGVEVGELARSLESGNQISFQEYQYLNVEPEPASNLRSRHQLREPKSRRPSLLPIFVFLVLLVAAGFGIQIWLNAQRLGNLGQKKTAALADAAPAETSAPEAAVAPEAAKTDPAEPTAAAADAAPSSPRTLEDRDFLNPGAASTSDTADASTVSELAIDAAKKSWVTVRRDDPASEPIFDDYLYANVGPLRVTGRKFFVEVREDGDVTISKDGQPLAYQAPGITVE